MLRVNRARKALCWSWLETAEGFRGSDGVHAYEVVSLSGAWAVMIDGAPLRSRSQRALRQFASCNSALWHAELEAERRSRAAVLS